MLKKLLLLVFAIESKQQSFRGEIIMDKVILAKNVVLEGELGSSRPNDNQIIFGGTGTGKSMSIVLPTLCSMRESSLIGTFAKKVLF